MPGVVAKRHYSPKCLISALVCSLKEEWIHVVMRSPNSSTSHLSRPFNAHSHTQSTRHPDPSSA